MSTIQNKCRFIFIVEREYLRDKVSELIHYKEFTKRKQKKVPNFFGTSILWWALRDSNPTEHGIRKALNLGHTAGHAFESLSEGEIDALNAQLADLEAENEQLRKELEEAKKQK